MADYNNLHCGSNVASVVLHPSVICAHMTKCPWYCDLYLHDLSFSINRTNNPVILHLLLSLTASLGHPSVQDLVTKSLCTCHDLLIPYFKSLMLNLNPQPTSQWVEITEVMIKVSSMSRMSMLNNIVISLL